MKQVVIQVEETIHYEDGIIVLQPEEMSNNQFDKILLKSIKENERFEGGSKDLASILMKNGVGIQSQSFNFPDNPRDSELEILDMRDLK